MVIDWGYLPSEFSPQLLHFIYTPFTDVGLHTRVRNPSWLPYRIEVFKSYTYQSLKNQTEKGFLHWLSFRPEEKENPLIGGLHEFLKGEDYPHIFTFDGLMYHDDRFTKGFWPRLKNAARIIRGCPRKRAFKGFGLGIQELWRGKNGTLPFRLKSSLYVLSQFENFVQGTIVYLTRIDSDDMFHKKALAEIQDTPPYPCGALAFEKGYIYQRLTNRLAEWLPSTNPPFHTIMFPSSVFFNAQHHLRYYSSFKSHEDIPKIFITTQLKDYRYCVLVHSNEHQLSTRWDHRFRGKEILENKNEILTNFGI